MRQSDFSKERSGLGGKAPGAPLIQDWLIGNIAESLKIDPAEIDIREPFASYGLSSTAAVGLTGDMEDWLGLRLSPTLVWDYPTIEELAQHLASEVKIKEAGGARKSGGED